MNDHELLKLAAEAAGYWVECREDDEIHIKTYKYGDYNRWNPLTDDGEALRLAVSLNLSIITSWGFDGKPSGSVGTMLGSHDDLRLTNVKHEDDPCAAWRRSIVIAASEIGRAMP